MLQLPECLTLQMEHFGFHDFRYLISDSKLFSTPKSKFKSSIGKILLMLLALQPNCDPVYNQ